MVAHASRWCPLARPAAPAVAAARSLLNEKIRGQEEKYSSLGVGKGGQLPGWLLRKYYLAVMYTSFNNAEKPRLYLKVKAAWVKAAYKNTSYLHLSSSNSRLIWGI